MKIILCDIDGTICTDIKNEDSHLYSTAEVIPGSLEQINKWYDE
jgi:histidinol phosphatase-like enzyme